MSENLQTVKTDVSNTWLCRNCGQTVIPFEKKSDAGAVEGIAALLGLAMLLFINIFFGLTLLALSLMVAVRRSNGVKKICPSCESADIIPANSPNALRMKRPRKSTPAA